AAVSERRVPSSQDVREQSTAAHPSRTEEVTASTAAASGSPAPAAPQPPRSTTSDSRRGNVPTIVRAVRPQKELTDAAAPPAPKTELGVQGEGLADAVRQPVPPPPPSAAADAPATASSPAAQSTAAAKDFAASASADGARPPVSAGGGRLQSTRGGNRDESRL